MMYDFFLKIKLLKKSSFFVHCYFFNIDHVRGLIKEEILYNNYHPEKFQDIFVQMKKFLLTLYFLDNGLNKTAIRKIFYFTKLFLLYLKLKNFFNSSSSKYFL